MNDFSKALLFILILAGCLWITVIQTESRKEKIQKWLVENEKATSVLSVQKCLFDNGPFWFVDEDEEIYFAIYKNKLEQEKKIYFRFGVFGTMTSSDPQ